jgi:hypothetical protein
VALAVCGLLRAFRAFGFSLQSFCNSFAKKNRFDVKRLGEGIKKPRWQAWFG